MGRERPPVLLIHGVLGQDFLYWNLFRSRLEDDGFTVREVSLPGMLLGDMPTAALFLQRHIEIQLGMLRAKRLDVIAHSAGGLVLRYYLKNLEGTKRVRRAVFLGTPHKGTALTNLMPLLIVQRQMRPGSDFIKQLNEEPAAPPPTEYLNLWTRTDVIVVPPENAVLDGARAANVVNVRLDWSTHWGFLWRKQVYQLVRDDLKRDAPQPIRAEAPRPRKRRVS
jgi:triacylglycerol lipase